MHRTGSRKSPARAEYVVLRDFTALTIFSLLSSGHREEITEEGHHHVQPRETQC
jgi:hypothetical protein